MNKARWIRLLYTHPAHYTDDLIKAIKEEESISKYLDIPIQHISDRLLKRMNRKVTADSIRSLIDRLRSQIPGLAIRSTVIVGFPSEKDSEFHKLLRFMEEVRFERLGAFIYSNEEGARSYRFKGQIPESVKEERLDEVMKLQQKISLEHNKSFLNRELDVLIDEQDDRDENLYIGRTEYDAPSVDGQVFVRGPRLKVGDFVKVRITDTLEYDLVGEVL